MTMDPDVKMGTLCQLLPDDLREYFNMNSERYPTYDAMRKAAVLYLEEDLPD